MQEIAPCEGLIPDHVRSNVTPDDAEAWVVDGFGAPHAVAAKTGIGRSHDGELVLLASSVSREHAELKRAEGGWQLRDLGSRNGTFVDGTRCQGRVTLPARSLIKIGDVAMWFLAEVVHEPVAAPSMTTGSAGGAILRYLIEREAGELCLVGGTDSSTGGSLLVRNGEAWTERSLPTLEFQLLRALCGRATEEASSPSTVRGCVATKQLARDLPFQSKYANEENVRQVVRRLRTALGELGAEGILAVAPGRGYYLACAVSLGGPDRR